MAQNIGSESLVEKMKHVDSGLTGFLIKSTPKKALYSPLEIQLVWEGLPAALIQVKAAECKGNT